MNVIDKYSLSFVEITMNDKSKRYVCRQSRKNEFCIVANIIDLLSLPESEDLIREIEHAENGRYFEEIFLLEFSTGNENIEIKPPNILLDDITIPMGDMKEILNHWVKFLKNEVR